MNSLQVKQLLNCDARFICEVGCNPKPTIEWRFNGKKIEDGGQYKIKTNGNTRTLTVKKLTAKNAGQSTKQERLRKDQINFLFVANVVFHCYHFSKQFLSNLSKIKYLAFFITFCFVVSLAKMVTLTNNIVYQKSAQYRKYI